MRPFTVEGWDWMSRAACRAVDPDLMYPPSERDDLESVYRAKAVCRQCPVARECLRLALADNEVFGIWGGLTRRERVIVAHGGRVGHRRVAS